MKKAMLTLFLSIGLLISEIYAQRLIPKTSINFPTITYSYLSKLDKVGFSLGIGYELSIGKNWYFQPEALITQKGANFTDNNNFRNELSIYYLEMMAPLKYQSGNKSIKTYLLGGPSMSIGLGGRYKLFDYKVFDYNVQFGTYDNTDPYNYYASIDRRIDFSLNLGIGIELWDKFILEARYVHGLRELYTIKNRGDFGNSTIEDAKNRLWSIGIGIPIKRISKN